MNEYPDNELVNMVCENSEDARDVLYEKHGYIVDIIYNKYRRSAYILSVDLNELRQEALVGFSDAIVNYVDDKNASLATFITLCVERRVQKYLKKADTQKNKMLREAYSLEYSYDGDSLPLMDTIKDPTADPSLKVEDRENVLALKEKINDILSPMEKEVYELLINDFSYLDIASILSYSPKQIDNTIQRIRAKIKDII